MSDINKLSHLAEFQKILHDYRPNIEVIDLLNQLKIVLLVAPAASGRNTIIKNLIMTGKYYFLTSDTTRKPRINNGVPEVSGGEYWFKSEEDMLQGLRKGDYLEAAIIHEQQVSGISINELHNALNRGMFGITDIDIQGSDFLQSYLGDAHNIFVLPPDFDEWMRRMDSRGAMDPQEKTRRLKSSLYEISSALSRDYFKFVINWDLRETTEALHKEILTNNFNPNQQKSASQHAMKLITNIEAWIKAL